jgi:predicted dehydrogenase
MLKVGIAGIGFMGMIHYLAWQRVPGARVVAISSRDPKKLAGDWRGIQGNFGPPGKQMNLRDVQAFDNFEDLVAQPDIDLIDICLPNSAHCKATIASAAAGKHVLCEKPIALTLADARKMLAGAAKTGTQLLIGHIVPFLPEYCFALATARSGKYGKLLGGHFKRIISDPPPAVKYFDPAEMGGPLVDLHIHDAHFIRLLFGMPTAVFSRGRMRGDVVEFAETQFVCADESRTVSATCGVIRQPGRSFTQGFEIHFERATLVYDFAMLAGKPHVATPLTVLDAGGKATQPKLGSSDPTDGFIAELREVARSLKSGTPSDILSGELATDALRLCLRQTQSVKSGRLVKMTKS